MKKKYYLLALLFLLGLNSCKNYLDTQPTDFLSPSNYYNTPEELNYARIGVYNTLGSAGFTSNGNYLFAWTADEAFMNRTSLTTGPWNYFYTNADTYSARLWSTLYDGINRANVVLKYVDKNPAIAQSKRDVIRGEMLFLRGFFYFQLATYFGGVPLKLEATSSIIDVDIKRATVREVYDQILKDMETAEPLVPGIKTIGYGGAISKSAVRGLLARVNLTMAGDPIKDKTRYAEASKWAKKVIDDVEAGHSLNPSYPQIFINIAQDLYDIKESIWEVEYWGNTSTQFNEYGNQAYINGLSSNATHGTGAQYMTTTAKLYDAYESGDNRKWWCVPLFTYSTAANAVCGDKVMVGLPTTQIVKNQKAPGKWRREYETLTPKAINCSPQNVILLRYSDILLMYAEAENEVNNGPTPAAIDAVNKVRERAWSTGVKSISITNGGSGYTSVPTVTFSTGSGSGVQAKTASGTAVISGGKVTAINLDRDTKGITFNVEGQYTTPPTITISGGGGTGATAVATIFSKTDADLTSAQTASKESFLTFLQDERMRELNMENLRKADLLRWGIFLQVNQDMANRLTVESPGSAFIKYYSNVSSRDLLMPIPSSESMTNRAIEQNPGW
jgi:hypothetical protein